MRRQLGFFPKSALAQLDQGNETGAVNKLRIFILQVNAFINAGILPPAEGQLLIAAAQAVIVCILDPEEICLEILPSV